MIESIWCSVMEWHSIYSRKLHECNLTSMFVCLNVKLNHNEQKFETIQFEFSKEAHNKVFVRRYLVCNFLQQFCFTVCSIMLLVSHLIIWYY